MKCESRKIQIIFLAVVTILLVAARSDEGTFQQIIDETSNVKLKEKLIAFGKGGVENAIPNNLYDIDSVILYAESLVGTPHRMGGRTSRGIDCSGLVMMAHAHVNVNLPHSSHEQARYGKIVLPAELKRGDLLFFYGTYKTNNLVTHSGIYLGDGKFIHTSVNQGVMISEVFTSAYWSSHYLFATRLREE